MTLEDGFAEWFEPVSKKLEGQTQLDQLGSIGKGYQIVLDLERDELEISINSASPLFVKQHAAIEDISRMFNLAVYSVIEGENTIFRLLKEEE